MLASKDSLILESFYDLLKISEEQIDKNKHDRDLLKCNTDVSSLYENNITKNTLNNSKEIIENSTNYNTLETSISSNNDSVNSLQISNIKMFDIYVEEKIETHNNSQDAFSLKSNYNNKDKFVQIKTLKNKKKVNNNEKSLVITNSRRDKIKKCFKNYKVSDELDCNSNYTIKNNINCNNNIDKKTLINNKTLVNNNQNVKFIKQKIIDFDYVDPSLNVKNNYENYIKNSLKSISSLIKFNKEVYKKEIQVNILKNHKETLLEIKRNNKKLLFLDLDETLVHSEFDIDNMLSDNSFNKNSNIKYVSFYDYDYKDHVKVKVNLRPFLQEFLNDIKEKFNICLYTASVKEYAECVISTIDPDNSIFKLKLYRDNCIKIGRAYIKDLSIFTNISNTLNFELKDIAIIDNSIFSFAYQLSNGILINSFYDDYNDFELNNIKNYLLNYIFCSNDVTFVNNQVFKFNKLIKEF